MLYCEVKGFISALKPGSFWATNGANLIFIIVCPKVNIPNIGTKNGM